MELTLLQGGLEEKLKPKYRFADAAVTDTRLMGVLGLRLHCVKTEGIEDEQKDIYYFFYYDIEEIGLDTLNIYELSDEESVAHATKACFGGLGAVMWPISEREAYYLVRLFREETVRRRQELPDNISETDFIVREDPELSPEEIRSLNLKMCTMMKTDNAVVNYYLMRSFGKDTEALDLLRHPASSASDFDDLSLPCHATFLKNTIEMFVNRDRSVSYMSESLVESENSHFMVTSELKVTSGKVSEARLHSRFEITEEEASMQLIRSEYVTVYTIVRPMEEFDADFEEYTVGTTRTSHETGDMYMEFRPDNSHVELPVFKLFEDVQTLYFVSDYGELIVAAYTLEEIRAAEQKIKNGSVHEDVRLMVKMELARSIMFDYAESGYTNFGQFIRSLE